MNQHRKNEQSIELRDILELLQLHIKTVLIFMAVFILLGILVVLFRVPTYQSTALLEISQNNSNNSSFLSKLSALSGISGGNSNETATQQYILQSPIVLDKAIQSAHLNIKILPAYFPIIGRAFAKRYRAKQTNIPAKPFLGMSHYDWGGASLEIVKLQIPQGMMNKKFTLIAGRHGHYQLLLNGVLLVKDGRVGQRVVGHYQHSSVEVLVKKLVANPDTHFTVEKMPVSAMVGQLKSRLTVKSPAQQSNLLSVGLTGFFHQPLQKELQAVIDSAIQMSVAIKSQKVQKVLAFLNQQVPKIEGQLNHVSKQIGAAPPIGTQFADLQRETIVQGVIYSKVLADVEQYELLKAAAMGNITTIMPATPKNLSMKLSDIELILLMIILGMVLGCVWVLFRHYAFGIIDSAEQIEDIAGLPMLAGLQISKMQQKQVSLYKKGRIDSLQLLSELNAHDLALEGLRSLRTSLLLNHLGANHNVITINGPIPNVGKSFIAANMAQQLAETGKKVLLIDADIRKGDIQKYFPSFQDGGLVDALAGKVDVHSVIAQTRIKNLDFLSTGHIDIKNVELLMGEKIEKLIQLLSPLYDCVVIDTAPVLRVSDPLAICRHANVNLIAFSHGKHNEREIDNALKRFERSDIKLHGFLINLIPVPTLGYGKRYYQYAYYGKKEKK